MSPKFSVTSNTPSDWVKGLFAGIAAAVPLVTVAVADNQITGVEWVSLVGGTLLAFGAALGFYSEKTNDGETNS